MNALRSTRFLSVKKTLLQKINQGGEVDALGGWQIVPPLVMRNSINLIQKGLKISEKLKSKKQQWLLQLKKFQKATLEVLQEKNFLLHFIQRGNRQTILGTFKNIYDRAFMLKELMVRWKKAPSQIYPSQILQMIPSIVLINSSSFHHGLFFIIDAEIFL